MAVNKNAGAFVPTTLNFDVAQLQATNVTSPEFKELLVRLYQNVNSISMLLNLKDTGQYTDREFISGKQYVLGNTPKQVFRKVIDFGALPNAGSKSVAHGITATAGVVFTNIFGTSSDTSGNSYIPLPYASTTLINNIELELDGTNVIVTTGIDRTAWTDTYIVVEFLKS